MLRNTITQACFASILLFGTSSLSASHITVTVSKTAVLSPTPELIYVAFADEPLIVDVAVSVYRIAGNPLSTRGFEELSGLDSQEWWKGLTWTITSEASGVLRSIAPGTLDVIRATSQPINTNGTSQHRGTFRLEQLPAGDYKLSLSVAGVTGSDSFAVRTGTESPYIRDKYLERVAARTSDYARFKQVQFERLQLLPKRADIFLSLAKRAWDAGTLEETNEFYNRAVALMQTNAADYTRTASNADATEVRRRLETAIAHLRAIQAELPRYFPQRAELTIAEQMIDGHTHFVFLDRRNGRIVRVVPE